jgi:D-alanyl-D-alanine carboxypeptidase/D-alanyl-D-alanine-endopeptidase (penicillin-binding protein 4)
MEIVGLCLPPSDNNLAENLLLMGAAASGDLGDDPYGTAAAREHRFLVNEVGVSAGDIRVEDGSGLTRHSFVTTRALGRVLVWEAHQPTASAYRDCLSKAGVKGTLVRRLQELDFEGKTGSLDMVSALSGYLKTKSGKDLVVSVILNEYGCSGSDAVGVIDRFVREAAAQ